jgi:hypothetical protein
MNDNDNDNDLYGDLIDTGLSAELEKTQTELEISLKKNIEYEKEINEMQVQIETLLVDKAILDTNIVAIFNTATREIARKDNEIKELRIKVVQNEVNRNDNR